MENALGDEILVFFMYIHDPFAEDRGGQFVHDVGVYLDFISFLH